MTDPVHVPVLLERVRTLLAPALDGDSAVLLDATVGLGGHAEALLTAHPNLVLTGLDRDPAALRRAGERLARFGDRVQLVHTVYDQIPAVLDRLGHSWVDGALFDLGVSSMQVDETARGFSYSRDAPLDMRMDPGSDLDAAEVVNTYPAGRLVRILREYGEERHASRIVSAIAAERATDPFTSTGRLAEVVAGAVPFAARRSGGHPAKRTFQALRIEVNGELDALRTAVPAAVDALRVGGRIAVLSYHSLEDRIVKRCLAERARDTTPPGLPVELPGHSPTLRLLTRGADMPSDAEVGANPRATSARLRAAVRLREAA